MLAEALERLVDLAKRSSKPEIVPDLMNPRRSWLVHGGEVLDIDNPPAVREHSVRTVGDIVAAAEMWAASVEGGHDGEHGVIWHDEGQVVLVIDDGDRRDVVTLPLNFTPQFMTLRDMAQSNGFDQRAMIQLLRHDLFGMVDESLLASVRTQRVQASGQREKTIHPGRERGSEEFKTDLVGELPDVVSCTLPVYRHAGADAVRTVRLSLEFHADALAYQFAPLPGELDAAVESLQLEIGAAIRDAVNVPVLFGRP